MSKFYFEMTDTFGGELNYCWLHRFTVNANTKLGAIRKISKETGFNFRLSNYGYHKAKNACVGLYEIGEFESPDNDWIEKSEKL